MMGKGQALCRAFFMCAEMSPIACPHCRQSDYLKKGPHYTDGVQQYRCRKCSRYFRETYRNKAFLPETVAEITRRLAEGDSIRKIARETGVSPSTVQKIKKVGLFQVENAGTIDHFSLGPKSIMDMEELHSIALRLGSKLIGLEGAEDVAQEAVLRYLSVAKTSEIKNPIAYMKTIAKRVSLSMLKGDLKEITINQYQFDDFPAPNSVDILGIYLDQCLAKMTERQILVFHCAVNGLTTSQIADKLGVSIGTVSHEKKHIVSLMKSS